MFKTKLAATISAATVITGMLGTQAMAATTPGNGKNIELNGQSVTKPAGLIHDGTTYMPIFYLDEVLNKLGITLAAKWDGLTWALQTPGYMDPNMSNIKVGNGNVTITLNGTSVQKVYSVAAVDPASGVQTTYLPIWYLEQVLNRLGVSDSWNGTVWNLNTNLNYAGKPYDAIVQYVDNESNNLDANSDPIAIDNTLFHEGYLTSHAVATDQQLLTSNPWSTIVQQNSILKARLTLFHAEDQYSQITSAKAVIPTTEVDTISFTDGEYEYQSVQSEWTLLPSSIQGIWQVDNVQILNQQSNSSGTSNTSGTASSSSQP